MKSGVFLVIICLLVSLVGCAYRPLKTPSEPVSIVSPNPFIYYQERLAKRFCPIIHLKGEGEIIEYFEPTQVESLVDQALVRDTQDPSFSEKATLSGLIEWSRSVYYLDIEELGLATQSLEEYKLSYEKIKDQYRPTIYARVVEKPEKSYTVVQYWIFYYFNDWRNYHEGDWEIIQLNFPGQTAKDLLENEVEPVIAAYSQHQGGQQMSWTAMIDAGTVEDTHPIAYVAQGSHANYFAPGTFWSGLDFDDTGLSEWQVIRPEQMDVVLLPETGAQKKGLDWLEFKGYWGEYLDLSISLLDLKFTQRGPFGPPWSDGENKSKRWEQPHEWSVALPEYPEPFWTSFFELPGDWSKLAVFSVFSPAELHVYDVQGRHVGINEQGQLETNIPGSLYITPEGADYKTIIITNADITDEYKLVVEGTNTGIMDVKAQVIDFQTKLRRFIEYLSVPISVKTIAQAVIRSEVPLPAPALAPAPLLAPAPAARAHVSSNTVRDMSTKLEIDSDGDGIFESEITPGRFIGQ